MRIKEIKIPYAGLYYHYLPWYDRENITFLDIARTLDLVFRLLQDELSIVDRNLYLDTAVEALSIYQRDLGLSIADGASIEERRKIIQGYLHYLHTQTTEQVVHDLVSSFCADKSLVDIIKQEVIDTYKIRMEIAYSSRVDVPALIKTLDKIMPAHLAYYLEIVMRCLFLITAETKSANLPYPQFLCGEHACGTIPDDRHMGRAFKTSIGFTTAINQGKDYYGYTNDGYRAGELRGDGSEEILYIQDFSRSDAYEFKEEDK